MSLKAEIPLNSILDALTVLDAGTAQPGADAIPADLSIANVTADSRQVSAQTLFVAIAGETHDGHDYVPAAVGSGAVAVLGSLKLEQLADKGILLEAGFPYFRVTNARRALAEASAALYGFPSRDLVVIGVTGTDGKTTTCTLLESILAAATRTPSDSRGRVGVITTVGARIRGQEQETGHHVTTPDAPDVQRYLAQMCDAGCAYTVIESTSHGLVQDRVAAVDFNVAAVTNITHEHLDYHGTREAYVQAKALLFRALYVDVGHEPIRFAVLNRDDEGSYAALQATMEEEATLHAVKVPVKVYGFVDSGESNATYAGDDCDVTATDIDYGPAKTEFTLRWQGGEIRVGSTLIGQFNVQNMLCAASVALGLGIEPRAVQRGLEEMRGISGRMERIDRGQPFLAVVDFAHSPVSLERALETLRPLVGKDPEGREGRLISVFGCAGLRDREKRKLMGRVSGKLADFTVVTAEDPRTEDLGAINREIEAGLLDHVSKDRYRIIPDRAQAIEAAVRMARPGDVVAAFGKGHERTMCFGTTEYPWSDQKAMADALEANFREAHLDGNAT